MTVIETGLLYISWISNPRAIVILGEIDGTFDKYLYVYVWIPSDELE